MNFKSVTGKNWILKDYDNNIVNFYKDNFLLDEVTSRLLAVRNINKEDVQLFLNPSIKNLLPDPYNLKDMSKGVQRTIESIERDEKIAESDWRAVGDRTLPDAWKTYRQQLRDLPHSLPTNKKPKLIWDNDKMHYVISNVTWPTEPSE